MATALLASDGKLSLDDDIRNISPKSSTTATGSRSGTCCTPRAGYTLAGTIVKRVSGTSLREFADERIFRPLGMSSR
jgi:CubicO group peptidase (beta-lactamase class C family)